MRDIHKPEGDPDGNYGGNYGESLRTQMARAESSERG
jgi:hypothetical protein